MHNDPVLQEFTAAAPDMRLWPTDMTEHLTDDARLLFCGQGRLLNPDRRLLH